MMQALALESFDEAAPQVSAVDLAYQEGFAAGQAAAEAAAADDQLALRAQLVQAINDLEFTYGEARGEMTRAMRPLLRLMIAQILPHLASRGFADELAELIHSHARAGDQGQLSVVVHPSQRAALAAAMAAAPGKTADTIAWGEDPALDRHAAWVGHAQGELMINLDQLLAEIDAILAPENDPRTDTPLTDDSQKGDANG